MNDIEKPLNIITQEKGIYLIWILQYNNFGTFLKKDTDGSQPTFHLHKPAFKNGYSACYELQKERVFIDGPH